MGQVFAGPPATINPNSNISNRTGMMGAPTSLDYGHGGNNNVAVVNDGHHDYGSSTSSTMMVNHRSVYGGPPPSSTQQPPPMDIPMNLKTPTGNQNYYDSRIGDTHASTTSTTMSSSSSSAPTTSRTLEKYFTQAELKRFNEYNRFLVMSSPEQQKKFYASLTSVEYKRFNDYLDMESQTKSVPPPPLPPPPPFPQVPQVPSTSSISHGHQPPTSQSIPDPYLNQTPQPKPAYAVQSSYSYETSYYGGD
ncbi:hypothetical protein BLA29_009912, partial [Euroglyphus maynei]